MRKNIANSKPNTNKKEERKMVYTYQFKVNRSNELLNFLLEKIDMSRNSIKGLLSDRKVLVNGTVVRQFDYPLCKDDEVKVSKYRIETASNQAKRIQRVKTVNVKNYLIYEDDVYMAFDKPHGLLSVESDKDNESLYKYVMEYAMTIDKKARPFLLHRIDKETSGVIVFTKSIELHSKLKMHWNDDVKLREYYCVVEGKLENKKDRIETYLMENSNNLMYSTKNPNGKKAITNYEVIRENQEFSLLRVTIDTGRKNQIRVHMKELGHPIVGDIKYGNNKDESKRLMLHASEFDFLDPISNKVIRIKAKVPQSFYDMVK